MTNNSLSLNSLNNSTYSNRTMMNFTSISAFGQKSAMRFSLVDFLANLKCVRSLSEMYSGLMEETITPRFTLHLIHAQAATLAVLSPFAMPFFFRILGIVWMAAAFSMTARAYKKEKK